MGLYHGILAYIITYIHHLGAIPASQYNYSTKAAIFSFQIDYRQDQMNYYRYPPLIISDIPYLVRPVRWSVILSCGQLQVRIFSLRSKVDTCDFLFDCSYYIDLLYSISNNFCFRISVALFLFAYWLRYSWMNTARPEGTWVARQADSILFTAWPPGPLERVNWYLMSLGSTSNEKGTTGMATMEIVLECSLPLDQVSGILMTLWTPAQHFIILWHPSP